MKKIGYFSIFIIIVLVVMTSQPAFAEGTISENDVTISTSETYDNVADAAQDSEKEIRDMLYEILRKNPIEVLVYGVAECNIIQNPQLATATVCVVQSGEQLSVKDFILDNGGTVYFLVEGSDQGSYFRGYIFGDYIVTNDTAFNEWRQNELSKIAKNGLKTEGTTAAYISANFPRSYQNSLIQLINAHPNWIFVPFNTKLDFNAVVGQERVGTRSLIELSNSNDNWKSKDAGDYNPSTGQYVIKSGSNWVRASEAGVSYCLNPLNYLDEQHIFAFEQLSFNASGHTIDGVRSIIKSTWMYNYGAGDRNLEDGSRGSYSSVFMEAGQATGVSPYHLASRVVQEQGLKGTSALISGAYSGYEGLYNYFNIQASGTGSAVITSGLNYARSQGWTSRYASIMGGASFIGTSYISRGQDTQYLQKFDVDASDGSLYYHQYMQNILAPRSESVKVYNAYKTSGALNNTFVFRIPIYYNTPTGSVSEQYAEAFVTRLYQVVLDRKPDEGGLLFWKNRVISGTSAADVVLDFFWSQEMKNKNLNDSEYMDHAYRAIMGREPDASGKAYWLNELAQGCTRNYVLSGFLYSPEFTNICNTYGINCGNINGRLSAVDRNAAQSKFVTRLYRNMLGREPDEGGKAFWVDCIQNGLTAGQLVREFALSKEFTSFNLKNEDYVEILYLTMLDRNSDAPGKAFWVNRLKNGTDRRDVIKEFLNSKEFRNICNTYNMPVGSL